YVTDFFTLSLHDALPILLFDSGFVKEAAQAQAQAVPLLNDLQNELNNPVLRNEFEKVTRPGSHDLLLDYISRCLTRALTDYPMLSGRTQLVVNPETRIIVVDVNNVAGNSKTPEGKLRTRSEERRVGKECITPS